MTSITVVTTEKNLFAALLLIIIDIIFSIINILSLLQLVSNIQLRGEKYFVPKPFFFPSYFQIFLLFFPCQYHYQHHQQQLTFFRFGEPAVLKSALSNQN